MGTGVCSNPNKPDLTACNDGNMCTTMDRCMTGVCVMGAAVDCNDNDPCTTDTCVAATGCVRTPIAGCPAMADGGTDAAPDAATDASTDRPVDGPVTDGAVDRVADSVTTDGRDGAVDALVDGSVDAVASDARDGAAADRVTDGSVAVTDAARDVARLDGAKPAIRRVGGGGGCDCDVGRRGPGGTVHASLLVGLALAWALRRRRRARQLRPYRRLAASVATHRGSLDRALPGAPALALTSPWAS